ncbi:hypothetical protein [Hyphomicrobium sp.]|uniref:hypothetical protein n=1 Tax=Hyphomicrobium sp. TaxID=82 RepID=UPI0025B9CF2E|nr:hypothetical protein [Hyphomicrobium sp.]MCC7251838.1 hypothetical protein [Hyphomicrobium sp.]
MTEAAARKAIDPRKFEEDFYEIRNGLETLFILNDAIGNGAHAHEPGSIHAALHFIIEPMQAAIHRLGTKAGLTHEKFEAT